MSSPASNNPVSLTTIADVTNDVGGTGHSPSDRAEGYQETSRGREAPAERVERRLRPTPRGPTWPVELGGRLARELAHT